jgi:hypothetical protein
MPLLCRLLLCPEEAKGAAGDEMALEIERVVNRRLDAKEALD